MCEFLFKDCCLLNQSQKFVKSEHFSTHFVGTEKTFVKSENSLNQSTLNRGSTYWDTDKTSFLNFIKQLFDMLKLEHWISCIPHILLLFNHTIFSAARRGTKIFTISKTPHSKTFRALTRLKKELLPNSIPA